MLALSEKGDNATVDMLVGDIYGQDYGRLGLKSTTIASSFGKVFSKKSGKKGTFSAEDISKSLLYAVSNNIGQIAYVDWSQCYHATIGTDCCHRPVSHTQIYEC